MQIYVFCQMYVRRDIISNTGGNNKKYNIIMIKRE